MPTIYVPALVFKMRYRLLRLRVHRQHLRLQSIGSPTLASHATGPDIAPLPAPIVETQAMVEMRPVAGPFRKKALLIGICGSGEDTLKGPHKDVEAMRGLLIGWPFFQRVSYIISNTFSDRYGYTSDQINVLLDSPNYTQPTKVNIVCILLFRCHFFFCF